jgi:hypothetical protein
MDPTMANSKRRKNIIIGLINTTIWCGRARPMDEQNGDMVFWIKDDQKSAQLQPSFCRKCGNYDLFQTEIHNNILFCQCN